MKRTIQKIEGTTEQLANAIRVMHLALTEIVQSHECTKNNKHRYGIDTMGWAGWSRAATQHPAVKAVVKEMKE